MSYYEKLNALRIAYPELTYDNSGYAEISNDVKQRNQDGIEEIESVLKLAIPGFVRFQNFKPRKDGSFAIRCQTEWSKFFTGVTYIPLTDFK